MLARIYSGAIVGLDAVQITVEIDIASQGLPSLTIVGLPDKAVEESKERVRAAIRNSGADFPPRRITVNLAPADIPKIGPAFDLPIAVGILVASGQLDPPPMDTLFIGELSLDGNVRHVTGSLPIAVMAKKEHISSIFLPVCDANEASVISSVSALGTPSLIALVHHLQGTTLIKPTIFTPDTSCIADFYTYDFQDIQGQEQAKRACEIASAGGHNIFLEGPPGAGKTLLARTFTTILPSLSEEEAIEVTKLYSVTGNLPIGKSLVATRPFRAPHHTTSRIGLVGGGSHPTPGEISLAHRGVLFLDEFPEYSRSVLEALRQPLEDGIVTISRARGTVTYPAKFTLIAAANPCPCGNLGSEVKACTCSLTQIQRYHSRISGPIMDRIDLSVHVPAVNINKLNVQNDYAHSSFEIQKHVQHARNTQLERFKSLAIVTNAEMSSKQIRQFCSLTSEATGFLTKAAQNFGLSARGYFRVIKVAQTIADLDSCSEITVNHIAEALQYRLGKSKH